MRNLNHRRGFFSLLFFLPRHFIPGDDDDDRRKIYRQNLHVIAL